MNAEINTVLEQINQRLDEAVINEALSAADSLVEALEEAGYEIDENTTVGDLMEEVSALIESDEFDDLDEGLKQKIKDGFKMVFGKLRKVKEVGKGIAADVKRMGVKRVAGEVGDYVRSGEAKKDAKRALGRAANKAMDKLDKATGRRLSKGMEKIGAAADKLSKGKFTKAMTKRASDAYDKRGAEDAKVKAYYKKKYDAM